MESKYDRSIGGMMVVTAAMMMLVMAHHPSSAHAGPLGQLVHGTMIALIAVTGFGFAWIARRRGIGRPAMLAGLIAYAIAMFADIGAATINGFVVTALAARGETDHGLFVLAWEGNQALARLGVVATGVAFLLWSLGLLAKGGWFGRAVGALGVFAFIVPMALLGSGTLSMNLAGALLIYGMQSAWIALYGLYVWSGRLAKDLSL